MDADHAAVVGEPLGLTGNVDSEVAREPDILNAFGRAIRRAGVVGEEKIAKLLFLALTSRMLERPVSIGVKGPSGGGKSYTIDQVLSFFPASAYFERTAMSPRNLAYTKESFAHRHIVLFEAAGMGEDDDMGQYLIRSLLSEGRLLYEYVDGKKNETVLVDKPGPTGLIISTTSAALHAENETRMLSVTVTDTREQTKRVLRQIAKDANGLASDLVNREPWMQLQTWLAGAEHRVQIPYVDDLADLIEPEAVRLRRDFRAVVELTKAHAILHQLNRERDDHGRIVANLRDYAAVFDIVAGVVAEAIGTSVSEATRETVATVGDLEARHPDGVSLRAIAQALRLDKSNVSRRASKARFDGYLENLEDRRGHPARYKVGEPLPDPQAALPEPAILAARLTPPQHPQHPQHLPGNNGRATLRATVESASDLQERGTVATVATVAGGMGEPLPKPLPRPLAEGNGGPSAEELIALARLMEWPAVEAQLDDARHRFGPGEFTWSDLAEGATPELRLAAFRALESLEVIWGTA